MTMTQKPENNARAPIRVMAHLVAGYPTTELARAAAKGLADGGVTYFEVQLPFSDPSADGKAIQSACAEVLSRGYRVSECFAFAAELRASYPDIPVFIMTYGNLAYKMGIEEFVLRAAKAGVSGLIIPDLPFDSDEGLDEACRRHGLVSVPVAAPSMTTQRLADLSALKRPFVYAALRAGTTGTTTTAIDESTLAFIASLAGDSRILGGFGIRSGGQAQELSPHVHAVVVGSVFVEVIQKNAASGEEAVRSAVMAKAKEFSCLLP